MGMNNKRKKNTKKQNELVYILSNIFKKKPKTESKILFSRSVTVVALLFVFGFGLALSGMILRQIVMADEYRAKAENQQLQDKVLSAKRGSIYTSDMKTLAESSSASRIYIKPSLIAKNEKTRDEIVKRLSVILNMSESSIRNKTTLTNLGYLSVKGEVDAETTQRVRDFMNENAEEKVKIEGKETVVKYSRYIGIDPDEKRVYSLGSFASTVIGFTGTDDIGLSGTELKYNSILAGKPGRKVQAQNGGINSKKMDPSYETIYDAIPGNSIVLTIDEAIQRFLEEGLEHAKVDNKAKNAYGIVMDVKTGAVLAMATKSDFDLNDPFTIADAKRLEEINMLKENSDERKKAYENAQYDQWKNKVITETYEPGSVFKIFSASAAIEEKIKCANPSYSFSCSGSIRIADRTIRCHKRTGHGTQTFTQGLMNSCNPFFITIGQELGKEKFYKYFEAFGFTEKSGIDLPAETTPVAGVTYHALKTMTAVNLASESFGQSFQVSPIQMITAISAIANKGRLMTPYVVGKILNSEGNVVSVTEPKMKRQVISEATANEVARMMELVVKEGTGKNAYLAGFHVAGKTGTSQKLATEGNHYIASFGCFAPADDAKLAILIAIDDPLNGQINGGQIAAPVAGEVMEKALNYLNVEPQYTEAEKAALDALAPDVTGKSINAAKAELDKSSLKYRILGEGTSVISQIPAPNIYMPKNGVVILLTESNIGNTKTKVPVLTGLTVSEANKRAVEAGLNIKITGNKLRSSELVSYRQSIAPEEEVNFGEIIEVMFKTNTGVVEIGQ